MAGDRARRRRPQSSTMSAGADLILDAALKDAGQDRFDHEAIAVVVADLALNVTAPANIALFGPWGSGKSSFFGLLHEHLSGSGHSVKVATYDAWKYGGRALKKHFVGSVAEQLKLGGEDFDRSLAHGAESVRLDLWTWVKENKGSLVVGAAMALALALSWFFLASLVIWVVNWDAGYAKATQVAVTTFGTVLSLGFAALVFGPKVLESAVVKVSEAAPETDDEFAKSFQRLVSKAINADKGERLVVFIDELDRCSPKDVVATLIDLKTFLDVSGCIFLVAADREVLERSLREVPQASPVRDEDPYYSTPGAFLDKIFQHQIPLPPLRPQALTRFARELVETQGGLWADLRAAQEEDRLFLRVVYGLVPVHVRSPRRVKVLLNNYATNVRIAQARGVDWLQRAEELATLTVLETEFPAVASDLVRFPSLLKYLRDNSQVPAAGNARMMVDSYRNLLKEAGSRNGAIETPVAGNLLVDPHNDQDAGRRANKTLVENLLAYLRKIEASGIDDPKPDLLYLQSAGAQEGIDDPDLAEIIDFAADHSASDVVAKFAQQPSAVVATAVRLLAQQADAERGPGRLAIIESVCRLTEQLDAADAQAVAPLVAGSVLAEASNPDWLPDATPGALILGVIGASKPLVETLLTRQDADSMAESGVLARIASVLTYASSHQAELVHVLLGSAYYLHPEPLHTALTTTPADVAQALWDNVLTDVTRALQKLAAIAENPTQATTAAAQSATTEPAAAERLPEDTATERFEALLSAVESRTDDQSEQLISAVLKLGQGATSADVRATASNRAEEALNRITDPATRNEHAMLGLRHSPLGEAGWWAGLLTEAAPAPDGYLVFEHLIDSLVTSSDDDTDAIADALPAVVPHVAADELEDARHWIGVALSKTAWSSVSGTTKNRAALYTGAAELRPRLIDEEARKLDSIVAGDLVDGLDANISEAHVEELLALASNVPSPIAIEVEKRAQQRATSAADIVAALRLRIAAAGQGSGRNPSAADLLAVVGTDGEKEAFAEWLALEPPLAEAKEVLGKISVYTAALETYARSLDLEERTALWIHIAGHTATWSQSAFKAIGKHGLNSAAVELIARGVATATQQSQRDALIDRLESAKLIEQPQHKAATDLVLQLLNTGIAGDIPLAARVACLSGGAAYGKTVQVRKEFDTAVASRPKALSNAQQQRLRAINLVTTPAKKRPKGLRGLLGG